MYKRDEWLLTCIPTAPQDALHSHPRFWNGVQRKTQQRGEKCTEGDTRTTFCLLDIFSLSGLHPSCIVRTEGFAKASIPSFQACPRWREAYEQKPASTHREDDRKSWELLTARDSSRGGADTRRTVSAAGAGRPSQMQVLLAPDPALNYRGWVT